MTARITCPNCQRHLKLAQAITKPRRLQCPRCGGRFKVDAKGISTPLPAAETAAAPVVPAATAKPEALYPVVDITQSFDFEGNIELPPEPPTAEEKPVVARKPAKEKPAVARKPAAEEKTEVAETTPAEEKPAEVAPAPVPEVPTVGPKLIRRPVLVASLAALVLTAAGVAGAIYAVSPGAPEVALEEPQPTQPAAPPTPAAPSPAKQADLEKRQAEVTRLLIEGNTALAERKFDDALQAYHTAQKLLPENVEAAKGIAAAKEALDAQAQAKLDAEKAKAEFGRFLNEGKSALAEKQFALAVRAFEQARQLNPGDADVGKWLEDARKALAEDQDEKAKLAVYEQHLNIGRAALAAQRYPEAIREFTAALQVLPGDADALQLRRQAENRIAQMQNAEAKKEDFIKAMQLGQTAGKAGNFAEAVQAFETALKIFPDDKDAKQGLSLANKALAQAQTQANGLLAQANAALQFGRVEEANRLFNEVLRVFPNHEGAQKGLRATEQFMGNVGTAQQAYFRYMNQAVTAMQFKRYDEAARNYAEALRLFPNDRAAAQGLRDARQYLEGEGKNRPQFEKTMQAAQAAYKTGAFREAVRLYQEAVALIPDDANAQNGLRLSRYGLFMADGEAAMKALRFVEAVRAFENALREIPGDPIAGRSLAQARALAQGKK
ncbi:MAG: tetratricopeptide repeat protein [Planctomycetia bacterium]|nr:tetratricopeptide repeat protein [Planctomycetia bacterium]